MMRRSRLVKFHALAPLAFTAFLPSALHAQQTINRSGRLRRLHAAEAGRPVWGRPVGVAVGHDGALYVTDDGSRSVWRVTYSGK